MTLKFKRTTLSFIPVTAFIARTGRWNFLMMFQDGYGWTVSYRLHKPTGTVSASSTIMGPFETRDECESAANDKWQQIKAMA